MRDPIPLLNSTDTNKIFENFVSANCTGRIY